MFYNVVNKYKCQMFVNEPKVILMKDKMFLPISDIALTFYNSF